MDLEDVKLDFDNDVITIINMEYFDALFKILVEPHETLGENNLFYRDN